jgi:hypothetical protein
MAASPASSTTSGEPTESAGTSQDVSDMESLRATMQQEWYADHYQDPRTLLPRLPPCLELPPFVLRRMLLDVAEQHDPVTLGAMGAALACVWSDSGNPGVISNAIVDKIQSLPAGLAPLRASYKRHGWASSDTYSCNI